MSEAMRDVQVRRVYDLARPEDGVRVLVDRLWPRGVGKDELQHDEWAKDVAPSAGLRQWFAHDERKFAAFTERYLSELDTEPRSRVIAHLRELVNAGAVTLLTATKDVEHSHAAVLAGLLQPNAAGGQEVGGESVCWLDRVCPECGRLTEGELPARCPRCGTPLGSNLP